MMNVSFIKFHVSLGNQCHVFWLQEISTKPEAVDRLRLLQRSK